MEDTALSVIRRLEAVKALHAELIDEQRRPSVLF